MDMNGQLHAPAALSSEKELLIFILEEAWWTPEPV
jgi:hypothetical protein